MTNTTDYTIAADTDRGTVVIAEVTHSDINEQGTIEYVSPHEVVIDDNVRTDIRLDREFVDSIREYGVLQPVPCRRDDAGRIVARFGQRRVLGAREAERPLIPVYVAEGDDSTVQRLLEQFAENEHRANLTEPERAAVFQQLAFEGLTVQQIAKRTGVKKPVVEAGIKVAESEFAGTIAAKHEVTLDQAAAMLEFEGDKDAVKTLVRFAQESPDQFRHEVQRQRDSKSRRLAVESEQASLKEQGFTILGYAPGYYEKEYVKVSELATRDGLPVTPELLGGITEKYAYVSWGGEAPKSTLYLRDDFKTYGFKKKPSEGSAVGPMTDEQKAERKTLIANNKAWGSAEVVRREWLASFLSRKTMPKDAAQFVAVALTAHRATVTNVLSHGNSLAATLLGLQEPESYLAQNPIDALAKSQPSKSGHVTLAVIVGAIEAGTSKETWRRPSNAARFYFDRLAAWGYPLSEVEQIVTGTGTPTVPDTGEGAEDDLADEATFEEGAE